jgi:hypothetical protein
MITEFKARYPDWEATNVIPNAVRRIYAEN